MENPLSSKILVIEDNQDTLELLHLYFTNVGYTVVTAVDGAEGLYRAKAEKPDVIITDLSMPNMDGLEMLKQIRSDAETAHIPIAVFTAHGKETLDTLKTAGADKVFLKPFDFDELATAIRVIVHQKNK